MSFQIKDKNISEFKEFVGACSVEQLKAMSEEVAVDGRAGIVSAYKKATDSLKKREAEAERTAGLYRFEDSIAGISGCTILGLDEVGRGPVAGPLTVGGVVLPRKPQILGLNDSKKLSAVQRERLSDEIREIALAAHTVSVDPAKIDQHGMTACLRYAFAEVVAAVEASGVKVDVVLLDGNPLHFDKREVNVVKGDGKCASIAAASIIAKVDRDNYMEAISPKYPQYCFAKNKGYGTAAHVEAIKKYGLTPVHRSSFCTSFMQMSLF